VALYTRLDCAARLVVDAARTDREAAKLQEEKCAGELWLPGYTRSASLKRTTTVTRAESPVEELAVHVLGDRGRIDAVSFRGAARVLHTDEGETPPVSEGERHRR
jgi:hypothetical protein